MTAFVCVRSCYLVNNREMFFIYLNCYLYYLLKNIYFNYIWQSSTIVYTHAFIFTKNI